MAGTVAAMNISGQPLTVDVCQYGLIVVSFAKNMSNTFIHFIIKSCIRAMESHHEIGEVVRSIIQKEMDMRFHQSIGNYIYVMRKCTVFKHDQVLLIMRRGFEHWMAVITPCIYMVIDILAAKSWYPTHHLPVYIYNKESGKNNNL